MQIDRKDLIITRDYRPEEDKNLILSTFLKGLYYGDSIFSLMPKKLFMDNYHPLAERLLESPSVSIKISCLKDKQDVVLGYSIYTGLNLHWVFIKKDWRNIGLARSLVPEEIQKVTHLTKIGLSMLKKYPNIVFDPFALT